MQAHAEPGHNDGLAQLDCMEKMLAAQDARLVALRPRQVAFAPRERLPWRLPSRAPSEGNAKANHPHFSAQNRPKGPENTHFEAVCARSEGKPRQLAFSSTASRQRSQLRGPAPLPHAPRQSAPAGTP